MIQLSDDQKSKIINRLTRGLAASYGAKQVRAALTEGIPKLFEHFEKNPDEEFSGDIILMFVQEDLKALYDKGYRW